MYVCNLGWRYLIVSDANQNYDFQSISLVTNRSHWCAKEKILHVTLEDLILNGIVPRGLRWCEWHMKQPEGCSVQKSDLEPAVSLSGCIFKLAAKWDTLACQSGCPGTACSHCCVLQPFGALLLPTAPLCPRAFASQTLLAPLGLSLAKTGKTKPSLS